MNDSTTPENTSQTLTNVGASNSEITLTNTLGTWSIDAVGSGWANWMFHYRRNSHFDISSSNLDRIPLNSRARYELDLLVTDGVTNNSILHSNSQYSRLLEQ